MKTDNTKFALCVAPVAGPTVPASSVSPICFWTANDFGLFLEFHQKSFGFPGNSAPVSLLWRLRDGDIYCPGFLSKVPDHVDGSHELLVAEFEACPGLRRQLTAGTNISLVSWSVCSASWSSAHPPIMRAGLLSTMVPAVSAGFHTAASPLVFQASIRASTLCLLFSAFPVSIFHRCLEVTAIFSLLLLPLVQGLDRVQGMVQLAGHMTLHIVQPSRSSTVIPSAGSVPLAFLLGDPGEPPRWNKFPTLVNALIRISLDKRGSLLSLRGTHDAGLSKFSLAARVRSTPSSWL